MTESKNDRVSRLSYNIIVKGIELVLGMITGIGHFTPWSESDGRNELDKKKGIIFTSDGKPV